MRVLGITSAIGIVGAGIAADGKDPILAECSVSSSIVQSERLIGLIDEVLKRSKLNIKDIDAVSVTTGPGSYSGLRGGIATAKGLVESLKIPIISVSTLHAIAFNFIDSEGTIAIAVNACRDDYNFALFTSKKGQIRRITGDMSIKMSAIVDTISKVAGKLILACDNELSSKKWKGNILLAYPKNITPWGINVASIGLEKLKRKETEDYISLSPKYSHNPNIREYKK